MSGLSDLLTAVTDFFKWCGDFLRNWSDEIADFLNAATTSSCVGSTTACINDGPIVRVLKGQVGRITDALAVEFDTFDYGGSPSAVTTGDGAFVRLIKGQVGVIRSAIDLPLWVTTFNYGGSPTAVTSGDGSFVKFIKEQVGLIRGYINLPSWVTTFDYGGAPTAVTSGDGSFVKFIKGQVGMIVNTIKEKPPWVTTFDYGGAPTAVTSGDGTFVRFLKEQVGLLKGYINLPSWVTTFNYGGAPTAVTSGDGTFVRFLKEQVGLLKGYINLPSWVTTFDYGGASTAVTSGDGSFVKFIKGQVGLIVSAVKEKPSWANALYHNDFSIAAYMDSILKELRLQTPLLKTIGSGGFDKDVIKIFEDIRDGIKKLGQTTGGKNIWDFLTELVGTLGKSLDSILDFVTHLGDWLIELIIPKDTSFITTGFNDLKVQFDDKLSILTSLKNTMTGMFNESGSPVQDYTIDLPIVGRPIKLLDMSIVAIGLPIFKKAMSGLIVIFTILHVYRKIVGNGGVMEK